MLKRIKYISQFSKNLTAADISDLVEKSARSNSEKGITGALMTSGHLFFQIIEGPAAAVDDLYKTICRDSRHKSVLLLNSEERVTRRLFPDWAMKKFDLDASSEFRLAPLRMILDTILESQQRIGRLTGLLEQAIWTEMTKS